MSVSCKSRIWTGLLFSDEDIKKDTGLKFTPTYRCGFPDKIFTIKFYNLKVASDAPSFEHNSKLMELAY